MTGSPLSRGSERLLTQVIRWATLRRARLEAGQGLDHLRARLERMAGDPATIGNVSLDTTSRLRYEALCGLAELDKWQRRESSGSARP